MLKVVLEEQQKLFSYSLKYTDDNTLFAIAKCRLCFSLSLDLVR